MARHGRIWKRVYKTRNRIDFNIAPQVQEGAYRTVIVRGDFAAVGAPVQIVAGTISRFVSIYHLRLEGRRPGKDSTRRAQAEICKQNGSQSSPEVCCLRSRKSSGAHCPRRRIELGHLQTAAKKFPASSNLFLDSEGYTTACVLDLVKKKWKSERTASGHPVLSDGSERAIHRSQQEESQG